MAQSVKRLPSAQVTISQFGSWVRALRWVLCWQLRAWRLIHILCLPLSLFLPNSCSLSLSQKKKYVEKGDAFLCVTLVPLLVLWLCPIQAKLMSSQTHVPVEPGRLHLFQKAFFSTFYPQLLVHLLVPSLFIQHLLLLLGMLSCDCISILHLNIKPKYIVLYISIYL